MSLRSMLRVVPAVFILGSGAALPSPVPEQPISTTYIFSQAICLAPSPEPAVPLKEGCAPQKVLTGSMVEIQLPGGPSVWKELSVSAGLRGLPPKIIASPGRIAGTSNIYQ